MVAGGGMVASRSLRSLGGWGAALALGSGLFALGCERASLFTEPTVLPAPTAATISPGSGIRGSTVRVTIVGTDFVSGATTVAVSGSNVTVSNVAVDGTPPGPQASVSADLVIGLAAATGTREITVATSFGTSNALTFTINHPPPTLTAISPATGTRGATTAVTLTGTHFVDGETTIAVSGSGVTVNTIAVASATSLTANFVIEAGAELGSRDVTVTTPGGTSGAQTFTIDPPAPTLTGVSPASGVQGATVSATLTGTNFITGGTTVSVSGLDVTVSNVSVSSGTSLTANFAIGSSAALGDRTVTVTTAGGTSGGQAFTVNPPAPTLTAVSPTSGVQGTTVSVTLSGTNFISGATTVAVSGSNVTVSNVNVTSATSLTANFAIASGAAIGARNVTVSTAGGTSGAQTFTVNAPAPTLTSISPASGDRAATVAVTLTGTNFIAGATVAVSGGGVTVNNVAVVSSTSITADFVIGGTTALGARNVTVSTDGGTSNAVTFTIGQPSGSQTFEFTGAEQTFTVPAGVTSITIEAFGAQGAAGDNDASGGQGGRTIATVAVTPDEVLRVFVGGQGSAGAHNAGGAGGFNGGGAGVGEPNRGGGGGGASDVRRTPHAFGDRLVVAGGGGGGGGGINPGDGGTGGGGGDLTGASGGAGAGPGAGNGGGGGTSTTGGAGGTGGGIGGDGDPGELGTGGEGGSADGGAGGGGGGGGGGLWGGGGGQGGGASGFAAAGGGGGSSFTVDGATNVSHTQGNRAGHGRIVITW